MAKKSKINPPAAIDTVHEILENVLVDIVKNDGDVIDEQSFLPDHATEKGRMGQDDRLVISQYLASTDEQQLGKKTI